MTKKVMVVDVRGCARCHGDGHDSLRFEELEHPIEHNGEVIGTYWAMCPTTRQPILMRTVEASEA